MKFVKIILISVFMLMNITFVSGCDMYTEFYIEHSENLQFLIGEEFADENLKGLAKTILNTTVDITDEMIIDLSGFDNTTIGTYEIVCTFNGKSKNYSVSVVEILTNTENINSRLENLFNNCFIPVNNTLSYEVSVANLNFMYRLTSAGLVTYIEDNSSGIWVLGESLEHSTVILEDNNQIYSFAISELPAGMQWLSSIINASIVTYQHDREISNLEFTQQKITYQGDGTYLFEGYSNEKSFKIYYKNNNITCIDDIMYYNTNSNEVMPAVPQI